MLLTGLHVVIALPVEKFGGEHSISFRNRADVMTNNDLQFQSGYNPNEFVLYYTHTSWEVIGLFITILKPRSPTHHYIVLGS